MVPGQILRDLVHSHRCRWESVCFRLPDIHNGLFVLLGFEGEVVGGTPFCKDSDLLPAGRLIVAVDVTYLRGIICMLDKDVGLMQRHTVMGKQGVEQLTQHTTLWYASVQDDGGGHLGDCPT